MPVKNQRFAKKHKMILFIALPIVLICLVLAIIFIPNWGSDDASQRDRITLTYANWNLGVNWDNPLELRMLQSFMDTHPHIAVEIDASITAPWMSSISAAAYENRLPDVFMVDDLNLKVDSGLLLDVRALAWQDVDFFDLPDIVQGATMIGASVYALPFTQNIQGYFINRDLFQALGMEPPAFGISADDFINAAQNATNLNHPSIGLNHAFSFVDWYPGAVNPRMGFFAFDGTSFALNSPEMLDAVSFARQIHQDGYAFYGISPEMVREHFPIGYDLGAFRYGQMAMFFGETSEFMDIMQNQVPFAWDFIGVPGGRSIMALDIIGISANTNHPEEAYLLAKWMGHGTEGNLRRLQYAQELGITLGDMPVTQNRQVLDALSQIIAAPSLMNVYAAMDRVLIDGWRILPGYMQARRTAPTGIAIPGTHHTNAGIEPLIYHSIVGDIYYPNYSATAEAVARQALEEARSR